MDIEVFIEGVSDIQVAKEIRRRLRLVSRGIRRTGEFSALVAPSETRGQWDFGVRGPLDHSYYFASFTTEIDRLPALVGDQLKACFS
jgi:hypothetical protein